MSTRLPRVDIVRNDDRQWFWRFLAANGRELARSSETYKRRIDCVRCLTTVLGVVEQLPELRAMDDLDEVVLWYGDKPLLTVQVLR